MPHRPALAIVARAALLPGGDDAAAWAARTTPALAAPPDGRWPAPPATFGLDGLRAGYVHDATATPEAWVDHVVATALQATTHEGEGSLVLASLGLPTRELADVVEAHLGAALGRPRPPATYVPTGAVPARIAARHGLDRAHALDAACASGLYALAHAAGQLLRGEVRVAVAAAVQRSDAGYLSLGFRALGALSPTFTPRPLDARADGLVVGEGAVAVVLKRLDDALTDGDEVLAVLRGWGLGNDGRKGNLLAPDPTGQQRALARAWAHAGLDPATLGFAELHATGTPVGDGAELRALDALVGPDGDVALGGSKALIGHSLTVAGLAGLLRAVAALGRDHRPGLHVEQPRPELVAARALHARPEPSPWRGTRRASVSAFGFGGTNAHVVLEAFDPGAPHPQLPAAPVSGLRIDAVAVAAAGARDADVPAALAAAPTPAPEGVRRGLPDPRVGWWQEEVTVDPSRYRIPPLELAELLPQQLLALDLCADALARTEGLVPERTAVVVGMEVDPAVAEAVVRWRWHDAPALADAVHPELGASRVQGSLPNFLANRIASQLDLQGPSYVVFGGPEAGAHALEHAVALLADDRDLDAVVVGAVDVGSHPGLDPAGPRVEGGAALVVRRGDLVPADLPRAELPGHAGAADALLRVALALPLPEATAPGARVLAVPHSLPALAPVAWHGTWGAAALPALRPGPTTWRRTEASGSARPGRALDWSWRTPTAVPALPPAPRPAPSPPRPLPSAAPAVAGLHALAHDVARQQARTAAVHAAFLAQRADADATLAGIAQALERAIDRFDPTRPAPAPRPAPVPVAPPPAEVMDRAALLAHASGTLADAFGPAWADLDAYRPRVRLPLPPLLLVSRVLELEGTRGHRGPARIVTEYDLPADAPWAAHDGRAPASIVVESGQADMLLASYLGVDETCRGERVYRLLDCDLDFRAGLPAAGTTLHHDIRIKSFAQLGDTLLFYFEYDCTGPDGTEVLRMRNGCAGFFTPAELATPKGCDATPGDHPTQPAPTPVLPGHRERLDDDAVRALVAGRFGEALDQPQADGSTLTLPSTAWRLVHRVTRLTRRGGAHGLGEVVFEQTLSDDDWFNPCHFLDDPCMPGTLMFEGCQQAVQLWLLGQGLAAAFPTGRFEPLPGRAAELRCRGQIVPGHQLVTYTAYLIEADLDADQPWARADVVLHCDGVPVVRAENVGVRVVGERVAVDAPAPSTPGVAVDAARVMEYSVGSVARAFGPDLAAWDAPDTRVARMPGPPYLTMTHVVDVEGEQGVIAFPRKVTIAYRVPADDWFFRADGASIPFAYLLEIALQPCGWLTAWQGAGLDADLRFRNLGGELTLHHEVPPGAGTLHTTVTQTSISSAGGLQVQFFDLEVRLGDTLVLSGTTHFGYFTLAALSGQKGLGLPTREAPRLPAPVPLADHPALPRSDWRCIDEVVVAEPAGGAEGLGFYAARAKVDVQTWFFTAHFFLDPVMPGSLGLEAILQLARWVHAERTGAVRRLEILATGEPVSWKYRGQVLPGNDHMEVELDVKALDDDRIVVDGVIRADGLPIYRLDGATLRAAPLPALPAPVVAPRPAPFAALLDTFEVHGDQGLGVLRLDPAVHPWLDHHRPTVTDPAVPLAFAAEIAAEAAQALAPDLRVVGLPQLRAMAWLHTVEGPVDLHVAAVRDGDRVAVQLAVHEHNARYPKLSGLKVRMTAVVALGTAWDPAPAVPTVDTPDTHDAAAHYAGGATFHGPVLQAMTALRTGPDAAVATLQPSDDARTLGLDGPRFVLDPVLLDAATTPMLSGSPEHWHPALPPGRLAYPVAADDLRLHGPRPTGPVRATLRQVGTDPGQLVFDVVLAGSEGPWCSFRWTEAITPAGPFLGLPAPERRAFVFDRQPLAHAVIGRATGDGWRVERDDLVEPLPGTLVGQTCDAVEREAWRQADDRDGWLLARLAAKEALRAHLRARLGRDVHPRDLQLLAMRADRYVLVTSPALTAQEWVEHVGPTRWHLEVQPGATEATARLVPADDRGRPPFAGLAVPASR